MIHSFYNTETGFFSDKKFIGPPDWAAINTPEGTQAIEGDFDHLSQKYDLATNEIVDYVPDQPGLNYEWDLAIKRWVKNAVTVQAEAELEAALAEISLWEMKALRPQRELALGDESAVPFLEEAQAAIEAARTRRQAALDVLNPGD